MIHVAAILDPEVKNERIYIWGHNTNWNDHLAILRDLKPELDFMPNTSVRHHLTMSVDQTKAVALLKKWAGQDGLKSLEDMIEENISSEFFQLVPVSGN